VLDDAADPDRWERWAAQARSMGLRSVLAVQLGTTGSTLGALNLYASRPRVFSTEEIDLATAYAAIAGAALHASRQVEGLETAVHSRHLIGVAQGILLGAYDLTMDQAFALMQRCSSTLNIKVRDLAAHVATHRDLPEGWSGSSADHAS
jgi:GAF domain-containing protein